MRYIFLLSVIIVSCFCSTQAGYILSDSNQERIDQYISIFQDRIQEGSLTAQQVDTALIQIEQLLKKESSKAFISAIRHDLLGTAKKYLDGLTGKWQENITFKKYYHLGYRIWEGNDDITDPEGSCGIWMTARCTTIVFKDNNITFSNITKTDGVLLV